MDELGNLDIEATARVMRELGTSAEDAARRLANPAFQEFAKWFVEKAMKMTREEIQTALEAMKDDTLR